MMTQLKSDVNTSTVTLNFEKWVGRPSWLRYGVAITSLALVALVNLLMDNVFPGHTKYLWLLLSFAFTPWFGGFGPAMFNLLLGPLVLICFIMHPRFSVHVESPADHFGVVLYMVTTFALFVLVLERRKSRDPLSSIYEKYVAR